MESVPKLRAQAQTLELEQCHGIPPRLHAPLVEVAHLRLAPLHLVFDAKLTQHLEERVIRNRVEMVVTLDGQTTEVEAGRHTAHAVVGLEDDGLAAVLDQLVGSAKTHWSRAEHGDAFSTHVSSEFQGDVAVGRIVERLVHGFGERRGANAEDAFPIDHLELIAGGQRLELIGRKRRVLVEHGVDLQQHIKEAVGNAYDRAACARRALDLPDDVDVIDALQAADIERLPLDARIDAADDDVAEVANVERLAHVPAAARNREHGHAVHEAREPAKVLAVEPAEHERRAQHDTIDARCHDDLFLFALGLRVPVVGHRVHYRRADMYGVGNAVLLDDVEHVARCHDVVAHERFVGRRTDLRLQHDYDVGALEVPGPLTGFRKIRIDRRDVRMNLAQDFEVGFVLVEHNEIGVSTRLEPGDQILSDQTGAARKNDASLIHALAID
ncbi:hypothetical protein NECAME_16082 [Necator americanus]|uniref:Uncharacterized protein n=1 Tax=Necator americanus TaxID=51031 RepID=W2TYW6_NECAM|nr:hypothetical protein NECAME_16082 [Necator americanus]ETN86849.1 hypothetical protein NECAME_16082 [Necator americanus]